MKLHLNMTDGLNLEKNSFKDLQSQPSCSNEGGL